MLGKVPATSRMSDLCRNFRRRYVVSGASTEWPGVLPADVEIGNLDELAKRYASVASEMRAITASVKVAPKPGAALR
jgi:hypothetical protein